MRLYVYVTNKYMYHVINFVSPVLIRFILLSLSSLNTWFHETDMIWSNISHNIWCDITWFHAIMIFIQYLLGVPFDDVTGFQYGPQRRISKPNVSAILRSIWSYLLTYAVFLNSEIFEDHFEPVSSHIYEKIWSHEFWWKSDRDCRFFPLNQRVIIRGQEARVSTVWPLTNINYITRAVASRTRPVGDAIRITGPGVNG